MNGLRECSRQVRRKERTLQDITNKTKHITNKRKENEEGNKVSVSITCMDE